MSPEILLRKHKLRNTGCRKDILKLFQQEKAALAHCDIEKRLSHHYDRVTIYRTLNTFLESGLIHKVLDHSGATKYALCGHECSDIKHRHEHVHFQCKQCHTTECLERLEIPAICLPEGYQAQEVNLLIEGLCPECRKKP
ncbi:MAG: transcriptional repressor [Cytophagales bacterium]|nr:transcriptional repressor [Cytophagales bacterium]